jgi:hypothetical protein
MSDHDMRNSEMLRRRGLSKAAAAFGGFSTPLGRSSFLALIVLASRTALILTLSKNWPKHITNMTMIPRCARRYYLATGRTFQGSTLKDLGRSQVRASPGSRALTESTERVAFLMRDLVIFAASFYSLNQDVVGASVFAIHPQAQERRAA